VYGKIFGLTDSASSVVYNYNTAQERISKVIGSLTTWYVRDAQGNTLALYDNKSSHTNWREQHLYGSSRLGMWNPNVNLATNNAATVWDTIGKKNYELTNHLGNVMATINRFENKPYRLLFIKYNRFAGLLCFWCSDAGKSFV
jgi:hypothetical protein